MAQIFEFGRRPNGVDGGKKRKRRVRGKAEGGVCGRRAERRAAELSVNTFFPRRSRDGPAIAPRRRRVATLAPLPPRPFFCHGAPRTTYHPRHRVSIENQTRSARRISAMAPSQPPAQPIEDASLVAVRPLFFSLPRAPSWVARATFSCVASAPRATAAALVVEPTMGPRDAAREPERPAGPGAFSESESGATASTAATRTRTGTRTRRRQPRPTTQLDDEDKDDDDDERWCRTRCSRSCSRRTR